MKPSRGRSASESHAAAGLEQEAPEEENAQDDGKRDDDDLDESHSRFLTLKALAPCRAGILSARGAVCQRPVLLGKTGPVVLVHQDSTRKKPGRFRRPAIRRSGPGVFKCGS
jgi:hypothetical protein